MRHAPTMQNLLIAILLAAHAGIAYAAEGPFFPIDLGTLGGTESYAVAVNDSGQIVGFAYAYLPAIPASWNCKPVQVTPGVWICAHAFSWTPTGGMVDLGTLGGSMAWAQALNASGQVVGYSQTVGDARIHAFSWAPGGMVDLGTIGDADSIASEVNASGQIVGTFIGRNGEENRLFFWTPTGGMVDIGTPDGSRAHFAGLNNAGQVVGYNELLVSGGVQAFSWTPKGGMVDLPSLGGGVSYASAVNNKGQVVGGSVIEGSRQSAATDSIIRKSGSA